MNLCLRPGTGMSPKGKASPGGEAFLRRGEPGTSFLVSALTEDSAVRPPLHDRPVQTTA